MTFAVEYKVPINAVCDDRMLSLRSNSLDDEEWDVVYQLTNVLKVRSHINHHKHVLTNCIAFFRRYTLLLLRYTVAGGGDTCYGRPRQYSH